MFIVSAKEKNVEVKILIWIKVNSSPYEMSET